MLWNSDNIHSTLSAPYTYVVAPRGRQHFWIKIAFRYYKRLMEDFLQRRSYRDSTQIHVKIEIIDQRIRKLSANEVFWCFYFGSNFFIGLARRRGHALAQNWGTKLLLQRNFCLVTLNTKPWFAKNITFSLKKIFSF